MKPLVIRVSDVGRAEAIDYRNYQYKPAEAEHKYYLSQWATLFFERKPRRSYRIKTIPTVRPKPPTTKSVRITHSIRRADEPRP